jgi:hypothetical protein
VCPRGVAGTWYWCVRSLCVNDDLTSVCLGEGGRDLMLVVLRQRLRHTASRRHATGSPTARTAWHTGERTATRNNTSTACRKRGDLQVNTRANTACRKRGVLHTQRTQSTCFSPQSGRNVYIQNPWAHSNLRRVETEPEIPLE